MARFEVSTQKQHWIYSFQDVVNFRKNANAVSRSRIMSGLASMTESGSRSSEDVNHLQKEKEQAILTVEEDLALLRFHESRIVDICSMIGVPSKVIFTCVTYFKRFHLTRSVMEWNPALTSLLSIYVGFKVEEISYGVDDLLEHSQDLCSKKDKLEICNKVSMESILNLELQFLEMLNFELICYHPHRSHDAFVKLLISHQSSSHDHVDDEQWATLATEGRAMFLKRCLYTDLQFFLSPTLMSIVCILVAARKLDHNHRKEDSVTAGTVETGPQASSLYSRVRAHIKDWLIAYDSKAEIREDSTTIEEDRDGAVYWKLDSTHVSRIFERVDHGVTLLEDKDRFRFWNNKELHEVELRRRQVLNNTNDPDRDEYKKNAELRAADLDEKRIRKAKERQKKAKMEITALTGIDSDEDLIEDRNDGGEDAGALGIETNVRKRIRLSDGFDRE